MLAQKKNIPQFLIGRKWILLTFLALFAHQVFAQKSSCFTLLSATPQKVTVRFKGEPLRLKKVTTPSGTEWLPVTPNGVPQRKKGVPTLPHYAVSLQIPAGSQPVVKVLSSRFREISNIRIAPATGKTYRNDQSKNRPPMPGPVYHQDKFYPHRLYETGTPYLLRNRQGTALRITPFQYNPVQKKLRVYEEITLEVGFQQGDKQTVFSRNEETSPTWNTLFSQHFLNPAQEHKQTKQQNTSPGMLLVSYGPFIHQLQDFIRWKRQSGFRVWVKDAGLLGNADSIKAFVQSMYRQHSITYLLLVGDAPQVSPGRIAGNPSDNFYAYVSGNDHYPDLCVGRFSAETPQQLAIMLQRTLAYEKALSPDTNWYTHAIGIGSKQGPGYHNLMDFQQIRFIDSAYLFPTPYRHVTELFDGTQGGNDAPDNPNPAMLTQAIEQGAGLINYCGHGSTLGWNTTRFGKTQVEKLKNTTGWPVIFSVSCATGNFVHQTCFAEKWLRASHNGTPTGAVAALMPTVAQSWDAPMCAQQEFNHWLAAPDSLQLPRTIGEMILQGYLKMDDEFGTDGYEATDTWVLFGDPSLRIRTAAPKNIQAMYSPVIPDTSRFLFVSTGLKKGCATLSDSNRVYATAWADNTGRFAFSMDSVPVNTPLQLVITAFNHRPFWGKVTRENTQGTGQTAGVSELKVFPNPVKQGETAGVSFVLLHRENIQLTLRDSQGRKTRTLFSGFLPAGRHRLSFQPSCQGINFLQLKTDKGNTLKKVVVY